MTKLIPYTYNLSPPQKISEVSHYFSQQQIASLPFMKYYNYQQAITILPEWFCKFLSFFPEEENFKFCFLDVKVQKLEVGELPCLPRWHIDIVSNPIASGGEEIHYIYSLGCGCPTLFLDKPFEASVLTNGKDSLTLLNAAIQREKPSHMSIDEGFIYRFTRNNVHSCQPAKQGGYRLLVRKSYSNIYRKGKINAFKTN